MNRKEQLRDKAQQFHKDHPEVWTLFVKLTFDRINRGFEHYSARAVFHAIRWETAKPSYKPGEEFKINNNITPFYSRRFMKMYPQYDGFFRTRIQISDDAPAVGMRELKPKDYDEMTT